MEMEKTIFLDPNRCIGCKACVAACSECGTHKGRSMIHLEVIDRRESTQTAPVVCMHCEDPTCARVCPADAIKRTDDGVVQSALTPRCIGCSNCAVACPFGVPKVEIGIDLMMKCDMCYDRTSRGKRPMCATVCPSGAIFFGTPKDIAEQRRGTPVNTFTFGRAVVKTGVYVIMTKQAAQGAIDVDFRPHGGAETEGAA
jgi:Fe-S-cluster-containing dehydrogenase component